MTKVFVLPESNREPMLERMRGFMLAALPGQRIEVTIKKYVKRRSLEQNAFLWGYVYPTLLQEGGEALRGWTADDLHRLMLLRHFGADVLEVAGSQLARPRRTSSKLTTMEFSEFVASIQQFGAELGVYIDDPVDVRHE